MRYLIMRVLSGFIPVRSIRHRYINWVKKNFSLEFQANKVINRMKIAIADPHGLGMADFIMFECLGVSDRFRNIIYSIPGNALVLDCGMNRGLFTDLCLLFKARVVGFEPNTVLADFLRRKYSSEDGVTVENSAVSNKSGKMPFVINSENFSDDSASIVRSAQEGQITMQVDVINLAEYILKRNERIFILKLDIEGAEFGLLEDLCHSGAWKLCDHIFVETHERFFEDGKEKMKSLHEAISSVGANKVIDLSWV